MAWVPVGKVWAKVKLPAGRPAIRDELRLAATDPVVAGRLLERQVDDRVVDDDGHGSAWIRSPETNLPEPNRAAFFRLRKRRTHSSMTPMTSIPSARAAIP